MRLGTILDSKILKKGVQIGPKIKCGPSIQEGHSAHHMASADRHFPSADWPKFSAWPEDFLIEIKPIFFLLFRDKNAFQFVFDLIQHPNLYK